MKPRSPQSPLRPNHALRTERPPGTLSPRWVELMMGYPLDWTVP